MSDLLISLITKEQFAALAGIKPASVLKYVRRGTMPQPDGFLGSTAYWKKETVDAWLANRPRMGRPLKSAPTSEEAGA